MQIKIKGTKYEPTEEIKAQVDEKVGALARFIDERSAQAYASVELELAVGGKKSGDIWRAELTIIHEAETYRAESTKAKLDHAITTVVRDVARELSRGKKRKERLDRKRGGVLKSLLRGFGKD